MPRHPAQDYADRCRAVELHTNGLSRAEIAEALGRPKRWVRRTFNRYDLEHGTDSLCDHSSRPQHSPNQTPADIDQAVCELKQAHPAWGRRQIAKQLRWRWRDEPERAGRVTEGRVRCVLARHPELIPACPAREIDPPRQIDYLACNILWAADIHETRLADGSLWQTLHWLDLHSRYELGQMTAAAWTENKVVESFLAVARQHGLPGAVKTDADQLWYDGNSGLPSRLTRVLEALHVHHLIVKGQPWWNGVVERYIQTCRQEAHLPNQSDADQINQTMEAERTFYNTQRCHSRCQDQPPATVYQPSTRQLPADFDPTQVPITSQPIVVTRRVQANGQVSLAGHSYPFSHKHAGQTITVTVAGWSATARARDGWARTWDLHPNAEQPPTETDSSQPPQPLTRKVDRRGCITLKHCVYYVGLAWMRQIVTIERQADSWLVNLPDGSSKKLPCKHLFPKPSHWPVSAKSKTPPTESPDPVTFQTRRVTKMGQVAFHKRLYFVGAPYKGTTVCVTPTPEGLSIYTPDGAWITTCLWKETDQAVEPLCPT